MLPTRRSRKKEQLLEWLAPSGRFVAQTSGMQSTDSSFSSRATHSADSLSLTTLFQCLILVYCLGFSGWAVTKNCNHGLDDWYREKLQENDGEKNISLRSPANQRYGNNTKKIKIIKNKILAALAGPQELGILSRVHRSSKERMEEGQLQK